MDWVKNLALKSWCKKINSKKITYIVDFGYNNTKYNIKLIKAIWYYEINYILSKIIITSIFRLLLSFQKNFDNFVKELL